MRMVGQWMDGVATAQWGSGVWGQRDSGGGGGEVVGGSGPIRLGVGGGSGTDGLCSWTVGHLHCTAVRQWGNGAGR
jgi:hypothetical protein